MFGLKKKEIDENLLVENLCLAVIDTWVDEGTLKLDKFINDSFFGNRIATDLTFIQKIMQEKLRFITGSALFGLAKMDKLHLSLHLTDAVRNALKGFDYDEISGAGVGLTKYSKEYLDIWTSQNPGNAGKAVQKLFSERVFGSEPSSGNVDANYILYKQLSSLQRSYIFKAGTAIRASKV